MVFLNSKKKQKIETRSRALILNENDIVENRLQNPHFAF